ncbi:sporulation protein YunB [Metabacillus halosaccharovorans]|uniref:sporulation protein YunB n=1 Tax=Metabacillus halosaccharovorans TaxID=930124 RepID=UPI000994F8E0|nr:sporulation protein YunB [Metabacillus halosaccharovorans]
MAKFRGRRPRRGPLPFRYVVLLTSVIFILITSISFWIVNVQIESTMMKIARLEANKVATTIIHDAVEEEILTNEEQENLVKIDKDSEGNVNSFTFNQRAVTMAKKRVTDNVTKKLGEIERNNFHGMTLNEEGSNTGIIYEIPLGKITGNSILSTLGPGIPIEYYLIGDVFTDIKRTTEEYGINNAVHEIAIFVEVSVQVVIPFATDVVKAVNTIPVVIQTEQGEVPEYYNSGEGADHSIELPKKP